MSDPNKQKYQYDPNGNAAYREALEALQQAQKDPRPSYAGTYEQSLGQLYDSLMNRPGFHYNVNTDALYQQYRDRYVREGKRSMLDALGRASALTGGYSSTYAQRTGQSAYDRYLEKLTDHVPELQSMALGRYNAQGQALRDRYNLTKSRRDAEYSGYQYALERYNKRLSDLQAGVDRAYSAGYDQWYKALEMEKADAEAARKQQESQYNRLVELMLQTGYKPSDTELKAAGMSGGIRDAYLKRYAADQAAAAAAAARRYGGSRGGRKKKEEAPKDPSKVPSRITTRLDQMIVAGEPRSSLSEYLHQLYQSEVLDKDQFWYLKNMYTPRGVVY